MVINIVYGLKVIRHQEFPTFKHRHSDVHQSADAALTRTCVTSTIVMVFDASLVALFLWLFFIISTLMSRLDRLKCRLYNTTQRSKIK